MKYEKLYDYLKLEEKYVSPDSPLGKKLLFWQEDIFQETLFWIKYYYQEEPSQIWRSENEHY